MKKYCCIASILLILSACSGNKPETIQQETDSQQPADSLKIAVSDPQTEIMKPSLGIGVVGIKFNDKTIVRFYDEPIEKNPVKIIRFFDDKVTNGWNIADLEEQEKWMKPEVLWLDYSFFFFRCTEKQGNWFKVIVNNDSGKSYWIKKDTQRVFSDWKTFLSGMFSVERIPDYPQKIHSNPSDDTPEMPYEGADCFEVKSMQGDWIEISSTDNCDETDTVHPIRSGWIKWRNKDRLMIKYYLLS